MKNLIPLNIALALSLLPSALTHAALLTYDGFNTSTDYTAGSQIVGQSGGTGWTGAYTSGGASLLAQNGGLTYTGLNTTAGQATVQSNFGFNVNDRSFSTVTSGDLWVSWLYAPGSVGSDYSGLGLDRNASGGGYFYIGTDGNGLLRIDTSTVGGTNATYGSLTSGNTLFLLADVNFTDSTISVYENPTLSSSGPGAAVASFSGLNLSGGANGIVFLGNGNGNTTFDELRVGTSFADVAPGTATAVPEPSTYALLFGGVCLLWVLRKKQSQI